MSQHDMVIDNGPGLAVRNDINAAVQALASTSLGPVEPTVTYAGQLWLDTSVPPNGVLRLRNPANAAWVSVPISSDVQAALDLRVRVDAAQAFTAAQKTQGLANINAAPVTAQARNRVVNGAMQISQENGNTVGGADGYFQADQWKLAFTSTSTFSCQRQQNVTPNGSANRLRIVAATANTSLAAGHHAEFEYRIEGIRVADFRWGAAQAKQVILRFGWRSPAGTYSIGAHNGVSNRSYIANFTITAGQAGTDTEQTLIIPGDTTGTWPVDNTMGMMLRFTIAGGTTFQGVAGWQAGTVFATSTNTNGMATANNTFELFDVGLYLDPAASGIPPRWEMPDEAQELTACQRYYQKHLNMTASGVATAAAQTIYFDTAITPMRTAPAVAVAATSNSNTAGIANAASQVTHIRLSMASSAAGVFFSQNDVILGARM